MSSNESQASTGNKAADSSEMDSNPDNTPLSSSSKRLEADIQSIDQQSSSTSGSKKIQFKPTIGSDISFSACEPLESDAKENKFVNQISKEIEKAYKYFSKSEPSTSYSYEKPHSSNLSTPKTKKGDFFDPAAGPATEKAGENSSGARPAPFKEFTLSASDFPFTKHKLAESLSLEEACGFLPYIMKTKRADLKDMENQLDQISIDLQIALRDAKNICILLENLPNDVPQDIKEARVQAQKLMYLLSSSFRIFEKLDKWGGALREGIQAYSKQIGDYHSSIDILLEYIMEKILEKLHTN